MTAPTEAVESEPRTLAPLGRRAAEVLAVEELGAYRLVWASDRHGPCDPRPGQFYMLATAERWGSEGGRPYLPRAFSYARVASASTERTAHERERAWRETGGQAHAAIDGGPEDAPRLGFLLDTVGPGTERLAELALGEDLWLSGPFGVGFRLAGSGGGGVPPDSQEPPDASERTRDGRDEREISARRLLVGGGIGAAPILALADELGPRGRVLLGFRSAEHAVAAELFDGRPLVATDDGSLGRHALVTDLLHDKLECEPEATVYACGPPPMLEAVRAMCAARGTPAQLALESGMACGYGACFGCVVPTRDGFVRLCLDGPVLAAAQLETALFAGAGH